MTRNLDLLAYIHVHVPTRIRVSFYRTIGSLVVYSITFHSSSISATAVQVTYAIEDSADERSDKISWPRSEDHFKRIVDRFHSLREVSREMKKEGIDSCGLIFAIDYTASNMTHGEVTFGGHSLHDTTLKVKNPYQKIIAILGETLEKFDVDGIIPAYGFGDRKTTDRSVFPLSKGLDCRGFTEVLQVYKAITPNIQLAGPTNFAPIIETAINHVKETKQYHILVIAADGQVTEEDETIDAIVKASDYPLSIIVIGVGDGPWETMEEFDDELPQRKFDNFQFVNFHKVYSEARNKEAAVALAALMEIPDQYRTIKKLRLLEKLM